ncbi:MAG TPA: response regulator [Syntrophobacteraceae bacterium]|jgi:DNA-binding NtrC family response regulator|nr:response regulator [Syntrophobacteraceae bacterium]
MKENKGRILVVDDEESIRRNLLIYLDDEGFEVRGAESGEEGLEMLTHDSFEAAIVDMRLPGIDGNTFIERAHELDGQLGFLIYTGSAKYQLPERLTRIGLTETQVFMKPLSDMTPLVSALTEVLQTRDEDEEGRTTGPA